MNKPWSSHRSRKYSPDTILVYAFLAISLLTNLYFAMVIK